MAAKVIRLDEVWELLGKCAPGYQTYSTKHYHVVTYKQKTHSTLPLGPHGPRRNPEIESGHVRQMARQLEITECAKKELPDLYS